MKGTDVTQEQLDAAESFLAAARTGGKPTDEQKIQLPYGSLVRLLAWYRAIKTTGSGKFVSSKKEAAQKALEGK